MVEDSLSSTDGFLWGKNLRVMFLISFCTISLTALVSSNKFEKLLPIDGVNLIYLRQLLKLRIFNESKNIYYSPFNFAIYILLKNRKISEKVFLEIIQGMNPYLNIDNIDMLIDNYTDGDILKDRNVNIPDEINTSEKLEKLVFKQHFKNQKSSQTIEIYWQYYDLIYSVYKTKFLGT